MVFKILVGILFILYPAVVYYGLTHGMAWFGLLLLILFFMYQAIFSEKHWQSIGFIAVLSVGAWFQQATTIKLIPIVIHLSLFGLFYQSLQDKSPLIEKFARLDFPNFPEGMARHCLQMTQIWTVFFACNIVLNIGLVLWATDATWALYNGMLVYIFIGMLVLGEYIWRRIKFPSLVMPSFKDTALNISKHSRGIIGNNK
ncbi:MAG: hypothetical protein COB79_01380 [Zetaproteobacteria bacterium]|nr:MAG: hypothetical protein COB79_01380 [Zetaproteobacteria bacterium]